MPPPDDSTDVNLHDHTPFGETEGEWGFPGVTSMFAPTTLVFGEVGYGKASMLKTVLTHRALTYETTGETVLIANPGWARAFNALRPTKFAVGRYGKSSGFGFLNRAVEDHQLGDESSARKLARMFSFWLTDVSVPAVSQVTPTSRVHTRLSDLAISVPPVCGPQPAPVHSKEVSRPWVDEKPQQAQTSWKSPDFRRPRTRAGKRM